MLNRINYFLDLALGSVLIMMVVLAPWMLGATTSVSMWILNGMGFILGGLWVSKQFVKVFQLSDWPGELFKQKWCWTTVLLFCFVVFLLTYVYCSALNPRASLQYTFIGGGQYATGVDIMYLDAIEWLPQSYDKDITLRAFWKYLAISMSFLAAREWFMGTTDKKRSFDLQSIQFPTIRMEVFLWVLAISSSVLSLIGVLQRLDGTDHLLWFFVKPMNGGDGSFGPYPYRSNGAQYLNLIWPVILGFWWSLRINKVKKSLIRRTGEDPVFILLFLTVIISVGVLVTNSRGGVLILLGLFSGVIILIVVRARGQRSLRGAIFVAVLAVSVFGGWLGGKAIWGRFSTEDISKMSGRNEIYYDVSRMVDDFGWFGSGAETFAPLYFFYRNKNPSWDAYVHNDYVETIITFGWFGFIFLVLIYVFVWLIPFFGKGIPAPPEFIILTGLALGGLLVHAKYDLPFQIYSLHFEFVIICALLTCLKWKGV